jgi:hypothetical protein
MRWVVVLLGTCLATGCAIYDSTVQSPHPPTSATLVRMAKGAQALWKCDADVQSDTNIVLECGQEQFELKEAGGKLEVSCWIGTSEEAECTARAEQMWEAGGQAATK